MKLFYSPASPFVRKVRVAAVELGLDGRIELVPATVVPIKLNADVAKINPLGKIPALIADDGELLYDSRVIVEYLDGLAGGGKLIPVQFVERARVKRLEALADGMTEAAILVRYEMALRPADKQWPEWIAGQREKFVQGLEALEPAAWLFDDKVDAGKIALACALGYLDFRFADLGWRKGRDTLARWHDGFAARPSMQATKPPV